MRWEPRPPAVLLRPLRLCLTDDIRAGRIGKGPAQSNSDRIMAVHNLHKRETLGLQDRMIRISTYLRLPPCLICDVKVSTFSHLNLYIIPVLLRMGDDFVETFSLPTLNYLIDS